MNYEKGLPFDIIAKILDEILLRDKQTVLQCRLVCKQWNLFMRKRLYSSIDFFNVTQIVKFIWEVCGNESIGNIVEEVNLHSFSNIIQLNFFVDCCPNLRSIVIDKPSVSFYIWLKKEIRRGHWKTIDSIPKPGTTPSLGVYADVAWLTRKRLTKLFIYDEIGRACSNQLLKNKGCYYSQLLLGNIASFPNIQSLDLTVNEEKQIYELDKHIDDCSPLLKELKISIFVPPSVIKDNNSDFEYRPIPNAKHVLRVKRRQDIKRLSVNISFTNDNSLFYLMQKFPSLSQLDINVEDDLDLAEINKHFSSSMSAQAISAFLRYLSKIRTLSIEHFFIDDACWLLGQTLDETITRYKAHCSLVIKYQDLHESSYYHGQSRVTMHRGWQRLYEYYSFHVEVDIHAVEHDEQSPHLELLESAGQQLKKLHIHMGDLLCISKHRWAAGEPSKVDKLIRGFYLSHIFEHCPQLTELEIFYSTLLNCGFHRRTRQTHLKHLVLNSCVINPLIFIEISWQLPSLAYLRLDSVTFDYKAPQSEHYFIIAMPYTRFNKVTWDFDGKYDGFCLKLVDETEREKYFKGEGTTVIEHHVDGHFLSTQSDEFVTIDLYCADIQELGVYLDEEAYCRIHLSNQ